MLLPRLWPPSLPSPHIAPGPTVGPTECQTVGLQDPTSGLLALEDCQPLSQFLSLGLSDRERKARKHPSAVWYNTAKQHTEKRPPSDREEARFPGNGSLRSETRRSGSSELGPTYMTGHA